MSVVLEDSVIQLRGASVVEDAEVLLGLLQAAPQPPVDLRAATGLHAAVVQILLTLQPQIVGLANDAFVNRWLLPILMPRPLTKAD